MEIQDNEQTLVLIKPDALKNSATGYILSQVSEFHTGLHFSGAKIVHVSTMLASEHYDEHKEKPFFPSLIEYITGKLHYVENPDMQRVIAIVYQGPNAIQTIRNIAGPTNPHVARQEKPGCIRALGTVVPIYDDEGKAISDRMDNLIHASANTGDAEREIKLWFKPEDLPPKMHIYDTEICADYYYYKDGKLLTTFEDGAVCFLAPGNAAWKTDLDALRKMSGGEEAATSLESVVAKYFLNNPICE